MQNTFVATALIACAIALCGCKGQTDSASSPTVAGAPSAAASIAPPAPPPPPPPPYTKADWDHDIRASYRELSVRDEGDGIKTSTASFPQAGGTYTTTFLTRDGFRKVRHFDPTGTKLVAIISGAYLTSRVSLVDCKPPVFVLGVRYFSKQRWLFLNQVSVMGDDAVVIDKKWTHTDVVRNNESYGMEESAWAIASEADLAALRRLAEAKSVLIRLTGDKGFVPVKASDVASIRSDIEATLLAYDALVAAAQRSPESGCD